MVEFPDCKVVIGVPKSFVHILSSCIFIDASLASGLLFYRSYTSVF